MSRMILVPIDISDKEFTERIISHVESEARIDDAEVHFLTVIPSLPYYASLGMAYTAELPGMDELREGSETQLKEIAKQFSIPEDRMHFHVAEGSPKDKILALAKSLPADLVIIASHRSVRPLTGCRVSSKRPAFICRWRGWRPIAARSRPCSLATIIRRCVPDASPPSRHWGAPAR